MQDFTTKTELVAYLSKIAKEKTIGFIPTMGALHQGHLSLIEESKEKCDITICSIFVNPTQFNNERDLVNYPNTINADLEKLEELSCNVVYIPAIEDLYENKETAKTFDFNSLTTSMEGKFRPGHFIGMATIVEKLFNIIQPTIAFFGQKDLQQLQIVKALVKQMKSTIKIEGMPTIREKNGLAKSSRNKLLSESAKKEAALIYSCLYYCKNNKKKGITELKYHIQNQFEQHKNLKLEYAEIVALNTMQPIEGWQRENENAICIAAYHSGVRLIDNIIL
ncbi:MAG TPA: pantoate--beta-alanine ligase [Flavobacteriales bacterium]|jgi:pantoate--beta-alanine ligase|nr:pantoate--beta-alanine ligase [Flavobacteriales bacterium]